MLKSLWLLVGLTVASALNATLEKSFFYLSPESGLTPQLFQTKKGIISYSTGFAPDLQNFDPYYNLIDLKTKNLTVILSDLSRMCSQGASVFSRLHYHALTYTLVYYCSYNNSLLIIDQDDYTVKTAIPTGIRGSFQEVRITSDGYSVAILGVNNYLGESPAPSHLIKISLQTQQILNHVIFDHGLNPGQAVAAYASNGKTLNVVTSTKYTIGRTLSVYSMVLIANSYNLTLLAEFNATSGMENTIPELLCIENLIVTNNEDLLIIMNQKGNVLAQISRLQMTEYTSSSGPYDSYRKAQLVSDYGSLDFYALWINSTLARFTAKSQGYLTETIGEFDAIYLASKEQDTNSLLFVEAANEALFQIIDLKTLEVLYQTVDNLAGLMVTDSTYGVLALGDGLNQNLTIFDHKTDALLQTFELSFDNDFYYDQERSIFSMWNQSDFTQYQIQQVDLRTGKVHPSVSFTFNSTDTVWLVHATNNENFDAPELVVKVFNFHQVENDTYIIVSKKFGQVEFNRPYSGSYNTSNLVVDYETLTAYYFVYTESLNSTTLEIHEYDSKTKQFNLKNQITNLLPGITVIGQQVPIIYDQEQFAIVDLESLSQNVYPLPKNWAYMFPFGDTKSGFGIVFSQKAMWNLGPDAVSLFYDDSLGPVPEATDDTITAGAAGKCSYWIMSGTGSFVNVRVFNICSEEMIQIYN